MDKASSSLDWTLLRVFVVVAEAGSLSAAARRLKSSQPTVGRQMQLLEQQTKLDLFHRHAKGLRLTASGQQLLTHAHAMAGEAANIDLLCAGADAALTGPVRIAASIFVAHYILPKVLLELRRAQPGIEVELVASDRSENLLFREADIALRMYRPTQLDITALHLGDVAMGAFAARAYLRRHGAPNNTEELRDHDLIGLDQSDLILRGMRAAGLMLRREDFAFRTDNPTVYWELLRAGCGIGFGQIGVAQNDPNVVPVLHRLPIPPLPLWIAAPSRTRHTPRTALVWSHLCQALKAHLAGQSFPPRGTNPNTDD